MQLLCLGDIAFADSQLANQTWSTPNGFIPDENSKVLINWELPIGSKLNPIPRDSGAPRIISFPTSPEIILKWSPGFAALATNHILDAEEKGLEETIKSLHLAGFKTFGAGLTPDEIQKPLIWETYEGKLAIINWVFPETNPDWMSVPGPNCWPGIEEAEKEIKILKNEVDWVMVLAHWSDEYFPYPRPEDREIARQLVAAGIDLMVCHHPHVVRGMEVIGQCPIFYSLGNFFFSNHSSISEKQDIKWAPRNREALGLQLSFTKGRAPEYKPIAFWQENGQTILDLKGRAITRLKKTSTPLEKYHDQAYLEWYSARRRSFFKWEAKWHFGVRKLGFIGSIRYVGEKIKSVFKTSV